jgi:copper chaperone CopZ
MYCRAAVAAKLKKITGVIAYDVDLKSDNATVVYDPAKLTIERLRQAIEETGFHVKDIQEIAK